LHCLLLAAAQGGESGRLGIDAGRLPANVKWFHAQGFDLRHALS
jgi:hypothetical protein